MKKNITVRIKNKIYILSYKSVKKEWFKNALPKSNYITHAKEFISDNGKIYIVDNNRNGVFFDKNSKDYKESKACAKLFRKIFGGKIELQPQVNKEESVSTCDLKWIRPYRNNIEKWDLKTVEEFRKSTLDNMIKKKKRQSHKFIFDIKNHTITEKQARNQIDKIFKDSHRYWVENIILKDGDKIIDIYERK